MKFGRHLRAVLKDLLYIVGISCLVSVALLVMDGTISLSEGPSVEHEGLDTERTQYLVHKYVNKERRDEGLKTLEYDPRLVSIANNHSEDMVKKGYYSHTAPDGTTIDDRFSEAGYECRISVPEGVITTGSENIAQTYYQKQIEQPDGGTDLYGNESEVARAVVDSWMNSPDHRENLMRPYWRHQGIGIEVTADNTVYATQNLC